MEGDVRAGADDPPQPVFPDGRAELVLHFGDPFDVVGDDGVRARQGPILFAGQLQSRLLLAPSGRVAMIGIRFRPHGAAALLRTPQRDLAGVPLGIDDVSPRLYRQLDEVRDSYSTTGTAALAVQRLLAASIDRGRLDARLTAAVETIAGTQGLIAIDRVADAAGMTRRHLERRFLDDVGISPKRLARIARFQRALRTLEAADSPRRGTDTAAACGYADQAHFIRDFRELAGCAPSAHLLQQGALTGFFVERHSAPASRRRR